MINETGKILVFNARAEFLFGYSRVEVLGEPIEMLLPNEVRERHKFHIATYMDNPRVREMGVGLVLHGLHRSGRMFPIEIKLSPMIVAGVGTHAMAVIRRAEVKK